MTVLWRGRWIVLGSLAITVLVALLVSASLTRVYATTSTLVVAQKGDVQTFGSVQAAQVTARSYTTLLKSRWLAASIAARLDRSADDVVSSVSFEAIPETQLIRITAEDSSPSRAQALANGYATEFLTYSARELSPITGSRVSLADKALLPTKPVRPKPVVNLLLAAILGVAAGVALAFLRERLDVRLRSVEDVEATIAPVPVLTRLPPRRRNAASAAAFEEAFRVLQTSLGLRPDAHHVRTLAVTSALPREGKTTVTSELARLIAASGADVLVVDADTRQSVVGQRLSIPGSKRPHDGLADYLVGTVDLGDVVVVDTDEAELRYLPGGSPTVSLSALLQTDQGKRAFLDLSQDVSLVLFDCPPLTHNADAVAVAGRVDGVLVVVDIEHATLKTLQDIRRQLTAIGANWIGVVLNRDKTLDVHDYFQWRRPGRGFLRFGRRLGALR